MPKPLRKIKPNPKDPDWKFPYAHRAALERIREYFESFKIPGAHPNGWHQQTRRQTHVLEKSDGTPWGSVRPDLRDKVEALFQRKLAEERAKNIPGWPTPGKIRSMRMNATCFGTWFLTGRRDNFKARYVQRKRIWLAYQEWIGRKEFVEREVQKGHTQSKVLNFG